MKRHIELYGSQDLKLPPPCLLTVWTESSLNPETCIGHALPLNGIDSDTRLIYVHRFMVRSETTNTCHIRYVWLQLLFSHYIITFYQKPQVVNQSQCKSKLNSSFR